MKHLESNEAFREYMKAQKNPPPVDHEFDRLFRNVDIIIKKIEELNPILLNDVQITLAFINIDQFGVLLEKQHARFKKHVSKEIPSQWRGVTDGDEI